ncbi:hypothetical protein SDC9_31481 [bioreactor metagenome]|uniref:Uncharacterized protein n=1 Tax=bioreactor metagenome TaxID=1076179 RepID=A0A644V3W6_9ZZZZ
MAGWHFRCLDPVMPTPEGSENTGPADMGELHDEADFITGFTRPDRYSLDHSIRLHAEQNRS